LKNYTNYIGNVIIIILIFISLGIIGAGSRKTKSEIDNIRHKVESCYQKIEVVSNEVATIFNKKQKENIRPKEIVNELNNKKTKNILAKWIYKHSKMPRVIIKSIIESSLNTFDPLLILSLIKTESNFNPTAVSKKGAQGMGQIMSINESDLVEAGIIEEIRDVFDIKMGMKATEFILKREITRADGDIEKALYSYLGANSASYADKIIKDYFYLKHLCKEELTSKNN
jgi:hypothetical protein